MKRKTILATTLVVAITSLGCSGYNNERGRGDAPVGERDDTPAQVINFPDLFMNVAMKCLGGNGIYTHTREGAPVVVANDPECAG